MVAKGTTKMCKLGETLKSRQKNYFKEVHPPEGGGSSDGGGREGGGLNFEPFEKLRTKPSKVLNLARICIDCFGQQTVLT